MLKGFGATLKRLATDRGGNVAMLAAGLSLPIMVSIGLSVDAANMTRLRSDIQAALDAAAMEMAVHVNSGLSDSELEALGEKFLLANLGPNHPNIENISLQYLGMSTDAGGLMSLSAAAEYEYMYIVPRTFGGSEKASSIQLDFPVRISSTIGDSACIYALSETASRAIDTTGNTNVSMNGCVIASNSTAADSIYVSGSASLTADCLQAAGQIDADGGLVTDCEHNREYAWQLPDPFGDIVEPAPPMPQPNPNKNDIEVAPGRYRNLSLDGTKTLQPGLYYVEGSLSIKGTVTGTGVTIFMQDGGITVNGNASLSLKAPETGDYSGMLFWSARSNLSTHTFSGNGATDLDGYLYFPSGSVDYSGNNGTSSNCMRIVADTINLTGSSTIRSDCSDELGGRDAKVSGPLYYSL